MVEPIQGITNGLERSGKIRSFNHKPDRPRLENSVFFAFFCYGIALKLKPLLCFVVVQFKSGVRAARLTFWAQ